MIFLLERQQLKSAMTSIHHSGVFFKWLWMIATDQEGPVISTSLPFPALAVHSPLLAAFKPALEPWHSMVLLLLPLPPRLLRHRLLQLYSPYPTLPLRERGLEPSAFTETPLPATARFVQHYASCYVAMPPDSASLVRSVRPSAAPTSAWRATMVDY
jgi:hypothetical protein